MRSQEPGLIQEGARTALSARYIGEMIETRGQGCPRSFREKHESARLGRLGGAAEIRLYGWRKIWHLGAR